MSKQGSEIPPPYIQVNLQSQTQTQVTANIPWWYKWVIYGGSTIFGVSAIICGVFTTIGIGIKDIFGGLILILAGLLVIALEVPILCSCVSFIEPLAKFSEKRKPWQKMILYTLPPIPVLILTLDIAAIFGSIFVWLVAFIYFYLFIRRDR